MTAQRVRSSSLPPLNRHSIQFVAKRLEKTGCIGSETRELAPVPLAAAPAKAAWCLGEPRIPGRHGAKPAISRKLDSILPSGRAVPPRRRAAEGPECRAMRSPWPPRRNRRRFCRMTPGPLVAVSVL